MYKYIIFDFDGTIANTLPVWLKHYKLTFKKFGLNVSNKTIATKCFGKRDGIIDVGIPTKNREDFYQELLKDINTDLNKADLFNGVEQVITKLKQKDINLSINTSSSGKTVIDYLKSKKLLKYFDVVVGAYDVTNLKPHPESLNKIFAFYKNSNLHSYVLIGDSGKDLQAATNASIDSVLFYPKESELFYNLGDLQQLKPTKTIKGWDEILDLF
jgi:phosphoglycolate phosphatase/pyrophosphatase PpaX